MVELPFRQIHLDFHTSPAIPDVAKDFNAAGFAETLKAAHVESVTAFARCHHGMCYYDTSIGPKHPSLEGDLLGEMIEACHARGIHVPVYITAAWDEWAAYNHPEWAAVNRDGSLWLAGPLTPNWHGVCLLNEGYQEYLLGITEEVLRNYPVDGLFMDIWRGPSPACACWSCLRKMSEDGVDPWDDEAARRWNQDKRAALMSEVCTLLEKRRPGRSVFFNGFLELGGSDWLKHFTHVEIESLPTGGWGYGHFPLFQRYFRNFQKHTMGMTARFHRSWGDFGGLKNQAALEYECFSMLAAGARCSVGDQLHPRGEPDAAVYDLIGNVYASVKAKEPWCRGAEHTAQVGLFYQDHLEESLNGAVRAMLESKETFDVIDVAGDFGQYEVIILPDAVQFNDELTEKVQTYLQAGGKLVLSAESGLAYEGGDYWALPEAGVRPVGPAEYDPNFICEMGDALGSGVPDFMYMMYHGGLYVQPDEDAEVMARIGLPYFNRNWQRFCSHGPTPFDRVSDYPAVVRKGSVIYFAHPIFRIFAEQGARVYRQLVENAIALLRPAKAVKGELPSTARIGLLRQRNPRRRILHILNYVAERRTDLDIIEDRQPLHDVKLAVKTDGTPTDVYLAPGEESLSFEADGVYTHVQVPVIDGHGMIVFEGEYW